MFAIFKKHVYFKNTLFNGETNFYSAGFNGEVELELARFNGGKGFEGVTFENGIIISNKRVKNLLSSLSNTTKKNLI